MNVVQAPRGTNCNAQPATVASKFMVIRLGQQAYGVPLAAVQEVAPLPWLVQPPGLSPIMAGVFNLAGQAVAAIKLARLFDGSDHPPQLDAPLVVLRGGGPPLALLVDEALGVATINEADILPLAKDSSFNDCAVGMAVVGDLRVIIVAPDRILTKTERQRLAESAALAQQRLAEMEGGHR